MKAAVLENLEKIVVKDVPTPQPDENEMLVKVKACAICGSDLRIFKYGEARVNMPAITGHEIAGIVERIGVNVDQFKVGDRIAIGGDVPCGKCFFCKAGMANNCKSHFAIGYQIQGGFAEYILLDKMCINYGPVHKIPDYVSYEEATLAEPLSCILNAFDRVPIQLADTVVVFGAGPIGCMIAQLAKIKGAKKVIVIEISKDRIEAAKELIKADVYILSSEENTVERVKKETGGLGAEVIFTACPSKVAQIEALHMAKNRAYVCYFGGLPEGDSVLEFDSNLLHYKELYLTGTHGSQPFGHMKAVELISSGLFDVKPFISKTFKLEDINLAFKESMSQKYMKIIITP
jgi:L-iditol 2-dehydrogenase